MNKMITKLLLGVLFMLGAVSANAQFAVTTNSGSGLAPTYPSLADAITALNAAAITSPVVITCPTGGETVPAAGYVITAQGTAVNTIIIQGNGAANSIITGGAGTGTTLDAFFKLVGADYVTIQGFAMTDAGGTTTLQREMGVALFHASVTNGAQNNTIQNNSITLFKTNLNTWGIYSNNNHSATVIGTTESVTNNTTGPASGNKVYNNIITNVNMGIAFIGTSTAANQDIGNDIGGVAAGTGNTITNWGGAASASTYVSNSGTSYCIYLNHQVGENVSFNTITSATISGTSVALRGIFKDYSTGATIVGTTSITSNTVTITDNFTSGTLECIRTQGTVANTSTLNINNNNILNTSVGGASSSTSIVGIVNSEAVGTLNITNNIIRGLISTATTGGFTGISNTGAVVTTININSNQVGTDAVGAITFSAATSAQTNTIINSGGASTATVNLNNNTVVGLSYVTSGQISAVSNQAASPAAINIKDNLIGKAARSWVTFSGAQSTILLGVFNTNGASTGLLTVTGNEIRNITNTVLGSNASTYIQNQTYTGSTNISSNKFINITNNSTGNVTFISNSVTHAAGTTHNVNSNEVVTQYTKTGSGGNILFYNSFSSSASSVTEINNLNNFSNLTFTGATIIGWRSADGTTPGPRKTVTNNTFNNITNNTSGAINSIIYVGFSDNTFASNNVSGNTISNITSAGTVVGFLSDGQNQNFFNNTITGITTTGTQVVPVLFTGGTTQNCYKNTICNIEVNNAGGSNYAIYVSAGTTFNIYNNRIGDLRAPITNSTNFAVLGLAAVSTTASSIINFDNNSININASSTGTNFYTAGVFHVANTTATTGTLGMRNNIIVNTSTPMGTGATSAFARSAGTAGTLANYASTSDRNLFYAGTPGPANLIYSDGVSSAQTLSAYKTGVFTAGTVAPRDANSISEMPPFLSTTCGNANFLKINTSTPTGIESGGAPVAGITDDFEGDIRNVTTPDIGADEFAGTPLPLCAGTPAASTITGVAVVCSGTGTTLSLSTVYTDLGITYQWQSGTTPGGPYPNTLGTSATQATGNLTVPTYYICTITCTNSGFSYVTAEKSVLINALPTVGVSPTSASICMPGGSPVVLTASGALTYTWSPTAGLTPTTGSPVSASPSATTIYTVTGTDGNGCTNTATSTITVSGTPQNVTATATPDAICSGGTSNLTSSAFVQNTASLANTYSFNGLISPYVPISGTVLGAGVIGDDVGIGNLPIGFNFNYNGTTQTVFGVSSNGLIQLGNTSPTFSGFSANALATTANVIAGLWDDNNTTGSTVQYATTGAAGNRVLTVQWTAMHVGNSGNASQPTISLQIKLYEATGQVQIAYGSTSAGLTSTTASIGISGAAANFISVTPTSPVTPPYATTDVVTENTGISSATFFPTGMNYMFTPPSLVLSYAWTDPTNLVSPGSQNTATTALTANETFTVTASNGGCSATAMATVTISAGAAISTQPGSDTKCDGQNSTFTVAATGPGLTYAWEESTDGGGTWNPVVNGGIYSTATTATLTLTGVTFAMNNYKYRSTVSSSCGSPVTTDGAATLTVNALPAAVTVSTAGTYCTGTTLTAANGGDGTMYFQGTTSGGTSTATPSSSQVITSSGTYYFRAQSAAGCWGVEGSAAVVIQTPASITTTPVAVCPGDAGTIAAVSATGCVSYASSGTSFGGTWAATPIAFRPNTSTNSATCSFSSTITRNYVATNFQVSVAGTYTFEMNDDVAFDGVAYLVSGAFVPGTCPGAGTFIKGDDDGGVDDEPLLTATLSTGVTYTMISTTYETISGTYLGSFGWTVTAPGGGQIMLPTAGTIEWYTTATGGTSIGSGSPFNPVGVAGSGLPNTLTPGTTVFYAACSNSSSCRTPVNFVVNASGTWTGTTDTDWNTATNWCGGVPAASADVIIPAGVTNMPVLASGTVVGNINLGTGSTLSLNGQSLSINGAVTGSGTFSGSATSGLVITGAAGTINFTSGSRILKDLSLSAGATATLGTPLDITAGATAGVVTVASAATLTTGGNLTLKSNAAGTARVGNSPGTISGTATVERYISNIGRKWRLLSGKTIGGTQTVRDAWQENGVAVNNLGTWLTKPGGGSGYDGSSNSGSLLRFDVASPAWQAVAATNAGSINDEQGYMLFVRGDRNDLPATLGNSPTVLRTTGTLNQHAQAAIPVLLANPGYTLIGNPFASPIDFGNFYTTTNLQQDFYIWDAGLSGNFGVGGYRLVSRDGSGNYTVTPNGGLSNEASMRYISSGQAFFVKAIGGNASLALDESSKAAGTPEVLPIVAGPGDQQLLVNLAVKAGSTASVFDGIRVRFDDAYSAGISDDAEKISNFSENLAIVKANKKWVVERRPLLTSKDTIWLRLNNTGVKSYQFQLSTINFNQPAVTAWLQDAYLGTNTAIDLAGNNTDVNFSITSDAASANPDRFRIVFAAAPQPQTIVTVTAAQKNNAVEVEWKAANQYNMKQYEVERSTDGINYTKVNTQAAMGTNGTDVVYRWLDLNPVVGSLQQPADNFYRIRSVDVNAAVKIAGPVSVKMGKGDAAITVYPNPVTGHRVSLKFTGMEKGMYQVMLFNTTGQLVFTKQVVHSGGTATQTLVFDHGIAKGTYRLQVTKPDNSKTMQTIIIAE